MNLRQPRREDPDISLTPLIDVVFLLLIFFMVSTTFTRESEISVDLPEASAQATENEQHPIELTIDVSGNYYVNQKQVVNNQMTTLMKALELAMGGKDQPALIISADGRTPHQAVITAMDAARQLGIVSLSLATKETKETAATP